MALAFALALLLSPPSLAETAGAPGAERQEWTIDQLLSDLRQVKRVKARFTERRYMQVLREPLDSSGTLLYEAPDRLEKTTLRPTSERLRIDGQQLTIERNAEGRVMTFALGEHPEIDVFVQSIRSTLAGDETALTRVYAVTLLGDAADWQLLMQPKESRMRDLLKWIRISGASTSVRKIDLQDGDGDRTEMTITEETR
jgi:hypothetical protein